MFVNLTNYSLSAIATRWPSISASVKVLKSTQTQMSTWLHADIRELIKTVCSHFSTPEFGVFFRHHSHLQLSAFEIHGKYGRQTWDRHLVDRRHTALYWQNVCILYISLLNTYISHLYGSVVGELRLFFEFFLKVTVALRVFDPNARRPEATEIPGWVTFIEHRPQLRVHSNEHHTWETDDTLTTLYAQ